MPTDSVRSSVKSAPPCEDGFSCSVPTTCQPPSAWGKDPWPATIRDITTTELRMTLNRRFERGTGMAIELPGDDGTSSTVLARVTDLRALADGVWLLGCTFISELGSDEVQHVLQLGPLGHAGIEGRGGPTPAPVAAAVHGVLFQAQTEAGEMLRWFVKRLDLAGTWPLPKDKVVAMRVGGLPPETPPVELRVRRCKQYGSYWIIDCHFVSTPADRILATLTAPTSDRM